MSVLDRLASALGRRDEKPNVALAEELVRRGDTAGVAELAHALVHGTPAIAGDAIKALYEIGERNPRLIAPHIDAFFSTLSSKHNRLVWGALSALDTVAAIESKRMAKRLPEILEIWDKTSVIGKDKTVSILCKLVAAGYEEPAIATLLGILKTSAVNQTPMYAEHVGAVIPPAHERALRAILQRRLAQITQTSKRTRIEKVLRKLGSDRA